MIQLHVAKHDGASAKLAPCRGRACAVGLLSPAVRPAATWVDGSPIFWACWRPSTTNTPLIPIRPVQWLASTHLPAYTPCSSRPCMQSSHTLRTPPSLPAFERSVGDACIVTRTLEYLRGPEDDPPYRYFCCSCWCVASAVLVKGIQQNSLPCRRRCHRCTCTHAPCLYNTPAACRTGRYRRRATASS